MHVDLKVPSINMILYETEIDILKKFLLTQKIEDDFSEKYLILYNFATDCQYADYIQFELIDYLLPFFYKNMEQAVFVGDRIAIDIFCAFNEALFKNKNVFIEAVGEEKFEGIVNHYVNCTCKKIEEQMINVLEWVPLFNTTIAMNDKSIQMIFRKISRGTLNIKFYFLQYLSVLLFKESDNLLVQNELKPFWSSEIWNFYDEGSMLWSKESVAFFDETINSTYIMKLFERISILLHERFDEDTFDCIRQEIEDSFSNGIFIKRKAEYLIKISSNAEKYKYWEETF